MQSVISNFSHSSKQVIIDEELCKYLSERDQSSLDLPSGTKGKFTNEVTNDELLGNNQIHQVLRKKNGGHLLEAKGIFLFSLEL